MEKIKEKTKKINDLDFKETVEKAKKLKFFNIGFFAWFLISFFISWNVLTPILADGNKGKGLLIVLAIYMVSIYVSLTPFAEWVFRKIAGARPLLTKKEINYLEPIFIEVYEKAKATNGNITDDIKLYIVDDMVPNASAIGKKTITVTRGLIDSMTVDEIKAVIAHEFAHIGNGDTQAILIATVGNFTLAAILFVIRIFATLLSGMLYLFSFMDRSNAGVVVGNGINLGVRALDFVIFGAITLGVIAANFSSRQAEFEADSFSAKLGYGEYLINSLEKLEHFSGGPKKMGISQALSSTHPATPYRIANIEKQLDL